MSTLEIITRAALLTLLAAPVVITLYAVAYAISTRIGTKGGRA